MTSRIDLGSDKIAWQVPIEFDPNGRIAVSSCVIELSLPTPRLISLRSNLVEDDVFNPDGDILTQSSRTRALSTPDSNFNSFTYIDYRASHLEFWKIDSARPRLLIFTFLGIEVKHINHFSIVLVVE